MFAQFSARLYESAMNAGYSPAQTNHNETSLATHWVVNNIAPATVTMLHLFDAGTFELSDVAAYDLAWREENTERITEHFKSVVSVYVLAGGDAPEFSPGEEYYGQSLYSIFWHINLDTKELSSGSGQTKKFLNLHEMVLSAAKKTENTESSTTFGEIQKKAPSGRLRPKHKYAILCYAIILINLAILVLSVRFDEILYLGVLHAPLVIYGGEWHRLYTATFLHFGFMHFFSNTFGILIFGTRLERCLGRGIFIVTYVFAGLLGSAVSLANLYYFHPLTVSAGASGAVYGIVGAIFAYSRITKHSLDFINWYLLLVYIGIGMAVGFATTGIDNFAHIGGLLGGALVGGIYGLIVKMRIKSSE
ncbi:MAG: rhomboid family intramembrane serine protease [Defluviitaleaceae bacterium]|nr:rhomboid family intramembrane serine protease [Defluviitaleaceae bacterium]